MSTATIPVTIEPEAAARISELGMQRELEEMLEHTKQVVSDLRAINVSLGYDYEEGGDPTIVINAHRPDPSPYEPDQTDWNWGAWFVRAFPSNVCIHFVMMSFYEPAHER